MSYILINVYFTYAKSSELRNYSTVAENTKMIKFKELNYKILELWSHEIDYD
jgi:hypothetical protein